jgi:TonB-linked SusC/RagA family outer membrane protein
MLRFHQPLRLCPKPDEMYKTYTNHLVLKKYANKILLMIRFTTVILIATIMQVSASSFAQHITLNTKNTALEIVLKDIRRQSGYDFLFSEGLIKSSKPISISVKNAAIEEVLEKCFEDQPITYKIENKTVLLKAKAPTLLDRVAAVFAGDIEVRGNIINKKTNEPLSGVTLKIKNKKINAGSNAKGEFFLPKMEEKGVITFSSVGFDSLQVRLSEFENMTANTSSFSKNLSVVKTAAGFYLTIMLEPSVSYLDEVMVQAYGTTDRRLSTGNIARISSKELEQQPVMNPLLALQGRIPGVTVTPTNGYASSPVKIEIRGRKTINSSFVSDPLYIIDGVPQNTLEVGGGSTYETGSAGITQNGFSPTGGQSPMFNINSKDIESIEVLKDGDATAIYGSRAANGVILITTKKGKPGATKFSVGVEQAFSEVTRHWDVLNTQEYLKIRREAFKNDNIVPDIINAPDLVLWDQNKQTDWQKVLWGNIGKQSNVTMNLSGGDVQTQFRFGANYGKQTEILTSKGSNQRAGLAFNLGHKTADRKFKVDFGAMYTYTTVNTTSIPGMITLAPNAPDIYGPDGLLNFAPWRSPPGSKVSFPFGALEAPYYSDTHMITSNLRLGYELMNNLNFSTNFGYNYSNNTNKYFAYISAQDPVTNPTASSFFGSNTNFNILVEPQLDYKLKVSNGALSLLLGGSLQKNVTKANSLMGVGYDNDDFVESINLAPAIFNPIGNVGYYKYAAIFGRINYNWEDKYIFNLNWRRDGSSRFGPGNQFGNFGSVAGVWILSKEAPIRKVLPSLISFLKLRGSYALTGSDAIGDYKYLAQWSKNKQTVNPLPDYDGSPSLVSLMAVNPNYKWQVNKKLEGSIQIGFLEDRINFQFDIYRERCGNQLTEFPTPVYTGFPTVIANWPAVVDNRGWDITVNADLIKTEKFNWSVGIFGSRNKNILVSYPDIEHSPYAKTHQVGKSINTQYLLHYLGVDPLTGTYKVEDHDGNGNVTQNSGLAGTGDQYIALDLSPKFTGGLSSNFSYKNLSLSTTFNYNNFIGADPNYNSDIYPGNLGNLPKGIVGNYWKAPGDQVLYPKPTTSFNEGMNLFSNSDGRYRTVSYVRLSNLSLSYTLNQNWAKKLGAESLRIYMNAQNVFVISNVKGYDPDVQQFGALPPAKTYLCGLSLTF